MRISDWSSDVCSSDLPLYSRAGRQAEPMAIANLITLTDAAAGRVKELIAKSGEPVLGLRVGVNTRGCPGLSSVVEYATEQRTLEDVVEDTGGKICIAHTARLLLPRSHVAQVHT